MSSGSKAILGDLCACYNKWCNKAVQNISFSKFTLTIKLKFPFSALGSYSINCPLIEKIFQNSVVLLKKNNISKFVLNFVWFVLICMQALLEQAFFMSLFLMRATVS